eukprot:TRINITY_DN66736_c7_g1_i1.p1 TRINITY_DN66736_c7_g1~~TRINITY_DN66736_c7_g1_i1.p1  ORF type:complete len:452 (+),score=278.91 TRINITY_DN66736_c7_g1_i1:73-1428(+)
MGKVRKQRRPALMQEIIAQQQQGILRPAREENNDDDGHDDGHDAQQGEQFVPERLSRKILDQVAEQQREIREEEEQQQQHSAAVTRAAPYARKNKAPRKVAFKLRDEDDVLDDEDPSFADNPDGDDQVEEIVIDADDEKALSMFMPSQPPVQRTLADIIMDAIRSRKDGPVAVEEDMRSRISPKVMQIYHQVGKYLSQYRSGRIPKAFRIIPSLKNWEEILYLTSPENWTAQAMFVATKQFASNLNRKMAQRFFNLVLLPRCRDDIAEHRKLNYHLYQSIKKCLYKPEAFFKGIILPLAEEGGGTLRESVILASILAKCSIPMVHSAAALMKLSKCPYSGTQQIFMKTLLDKKYSLPFDVVDAVVQYFASFTYDNEHELPVVWHKNLLTFVQRYKVHFTTKQKEDLKKLMRKKHHYLITNAIRKELFSEAPSSATASAASSSSSSSMMVTN